ncbi:MAG: hypothetical protein Kapaf2KO_07360 [Candidatus Kapaibacteriales bacterium]
MKTNEVIALASSMLILGNVPCVNNISVSNSNNLYSRTHVESLTNSYSAYLDIYESAFYTQYEVEEKLRIHLFNTFRKKHKSLYQLVIQYFNNVNSLFQKIFGDYYEKAKIFEEEDNIYIDYMLTEEFYKEKIDANTRYSMSSDFADNLADFLLRMRSIDKRFEKIIVDII